MAGSRTPATWIPSIGAVRTPARTPGPLGYNDQADPSITALLGDTPGLLGFTDHADVGLPSAARPAIGGGAVLVRTDAGQAVSLGKGSPDAGVAVKLAIKGVVVAGGELSQVTVLAVNDAATKVPDKWKLYVAYQTEVRVGGSLAWRANNPVNLRRASTKIGSIPGKTGHFAVFTSLEDGRAAQRSVYLNQYGTMSVKEAVKHLTPSSENNTEKYLADLKQANVDLNKDMASQIDPVMVAIQVNEGLSAGTVVPRVP